MIKTRIASTAAAFVVRLAAVGGTALTIAVPANAAPGASGATSSSASNGRDQHNGKTLRDQHEQSKQHPNKFDPPTAGPSSAPASTVGSNQETGGPTVPRSWYPEMPNQGG